MSDFIQESEVNEVLNKRKGHFTPELGNVYRVETEDDEASRYAKLISVDYSNSSPYLCDVVVREAISIDGKIEAPAKLEARRFDYSGVNEDGESRLRNLSEEDRAEYREASDIDSFNWRSPEQILPAYKQKNALPNAVLWVVAGFAYYSCILASYLSEPSHYLGILPILGTGLVFFGAYIISFERKIYFTKIYALVTLFLNIFVIIQSTRGGEMGLVTAISLSIFLFSCLAFLVRRETRLLNKSRHHSFMIGAFDKFVTDDGKSVVITNKFGDDNDFPMEGYIIVSPEIRNGDTVVREGVVVTHKWSYSGLPYGHKRGSAGFKNCRLFNTPEDAKVVLDLFNKRYGLKSKSKAENVSEKAGNGDSGGDMSENQTSFFAKPLFIIKNVWSSKSGKAACFMLIAWVVDVIFGYKLHDFLNYIIPALAACLAIYGAKSKLKI